MSQALGFLPQFRTWVKVPSDRHLGGKGLVGKTLAIGAWMLGSLSESELPLRIFQGKFPRNVILREEEWMYTLHSWRVRNSSLGIFISSQSRGSNSFCSNFQDEIHYYLLIMCPRSLHFLYKQKEFIKRASQRARLWDLSLRVTKMNFWVVLWPTEFYFQCLQASSGNHLAEKQDFYTALSHCLLQLHIYTTTFPLHSLVYSSNNFSSYIVQRTTN